MVDTLNKVKPGDPLKIPAATFNTLIDVARDFRAQQHNSSQSHRPPTPQGGIIPVRNDTGTDLPRFGVVQLDEPVFTPADAPESFIANTALKAIAPQAAIYSSGWTGGYHFCSASLAICQEPIASGQIGTAMIDGTSWVRLTMVSQDADNCATAVNAETGLMRSALTGPARILWREGGLAEQWALVRLVADHQDGYESFKVLDGRTVGQASYYYNVQGSPQGFYVEHVRWNPSSSAFVAVHAAATSRRQHDAPPRGREQRP